jgi:hypothetical protein
VSSGASSADAGGAYGQLGNSTQLKRLRAVMNSVHYLVDADTCMDKKMLLQVPHSPAHLYSLSIRQRSTGLMY